MRRNRFVGPPRGVIVRPRPAWPAIGQSAVTWLGLLILTGCAVGPNYHRPSAPVPQRFKESDGWKPAQPGEAASGTDWWSVYQDATLDELERQIDVSNQSLKASEASWREATALVSEARAGLFPTIGVTAIGTRSGGPAVTAGAGTGGAVPSASHVTNQFQLAGTASWNIDLWGKIRRTIESNVASAAASEADLAAARLSLQGLLATDYIALRVADEQRQLLDQTVEAYKRALVITQNRYKVGVAAKTDVITAETQLEGAESQALGLGVTRATLEHAIAVLVGKTPAEFSLAPAPFGTAVPVAPLGIPSTLLERRPDVAAAERRMAAPNARIGVAVAAYFPDLTLNGSYGFASNAVSGLISKPNAVWSLGGTAAETLLDFGARPAQVRQARAAYDVTVASYRETVLTAFQQVEDELATLRILEQQVQVQQQAVDSANLAAQLTLNQYKAGTVAYTSVITAQTIALGDAQILLTLRQNGLTASVTLIEALGGGWTADSLGTAHGTAATLARESASQAAPTPAPTPTTPAPGAP